MSAISSSIFGDSDCTLVVSTFSRLLGCIKVVRTGFPCEVVPLAAGGSPCDGDRGICAVSSALCCCCPWQSLSFLQVAVVGTAGDRSDYCNFCWSWSVLLDFWILWIIIGFGFNYWFSQVAVVGTAGDRPCWILQFLLVVIGFVEFWILWIIIGLWILWIIIGLILLCHSKLVSSSSLSHLLLLCCPIDAVGLLIFWIKKKINLVYSVRFFAIGWSFMLQMLQSPITIYSK